MKILPTITNLIWSKIGTMPFRTSYGGQMSAGSSIACIVNGYFSMLYIPGFGGFVPAGWVLYSFDANGNVCTYQSTDFRNGGGFQNISAVAFQSGNSFNITTVNNGTSSFVIPNVFVPGATFVIPSITQLPPAPCGKGTLHQTRYLAQQGLVSYEFINAFSTTDDIYASLYRGKQLVGGGYIGNFPSNVDGYDQFQQTLPPYVSSNDVFYKNGSYFYSNMNNVGYPFLRFGWTNIVLQGNPSSLNCGSPTPSVFITSQNTFDVMASPTGLPGVSYSQYSLAMGATDLNSTFAFAYSNGRGAFISKDNFMQFNIPGAGSPPAVVYIAAQKRAYFMFGGASFAGDVYSAPFDLGAVGFAPQPVVARAHFPGLANYHRAVSPSGTFQA